MKRVDEPTSPETAVSPELASEASSHLAINEIAVLIVLAAVQLANILDFMIVMPLEPALQKFFTMTPKQFGLIVSSYTFSACIVGLLAALVIDRFDRKTALLVLVTGFTLGTLSCGLARSFNMLLLARVVTGAFGGVLGALIYAVVGDIFPDSRRGRATGALMSAFALASVAGVPFGLVLGNRYGWQAPFFFLAGLGALVGIASVIVLPPLRGHFTKASERHPAAELWSLIVEPNHLRAFALMVAMMLGTFMVIPFLGAAMVYNAGVSEADLPWLYVLGGACALVSSPLVGRWADRRGKLPVYRIMAVLSVLPIIAMTNMPRLPLAAAMMITASLMVFNSARSVPAMALITASVEPGRRGGFLSVNAAIQHGAIAVGSLLAGVMVTQKAPGTPLIGYSLVGVIAVISTLLSLPLAGRLRAAKGGLDAVDEIDELQ